MEYFNPLSVVIQGTGALFNSSKKHFIWRFELDQEEHSVELECSFLTSKRRVTFDGKLIFKGMKALLTSDFQYQFKHKNHILTVFNHRNDANLIVDSLSFDIIYSQKILKNVTAFQSKKSGSQTISSTTEGKDQSNVSASEIVPKPARFISDEEYSQALKLSKNFETSNSKKSLRELLDKNLNQTRPPKAIFERDIDEGPQNEENKIHSARAKPLADNFLSLDESVNKNQEELIDTRPEKKIEDDFFSSSFSPSDPPKPSEDPKPSRLTSDFLEIDENPKPSISDLLEIDPKANPVVSDDFLSLDPRNFTLDLVKLDPVAFPSKLDPEDFLSTKSVLPSALKSSFDIFNDPQPPQPPLIPPSEDLKSIPTSLASKSVQNDFNSIFSGSVSLFSAPNK